MGNDYLELLKSAQWQRKRLEVLQRDNFTCKCCGSKEKSLHVHHLYYEKDKKPWEYPDSALVTLCEDCHRKRHNKHSSTNNDRMIRSTKGKKVFFRGLQKENRLSPNEKIVLSYILTHETENRSEIARSLSMSRKTVVEAMKKINELGLLDNKEAIMQHGYFILEHAETLTGDLLIFYSYLRDKSVKYGYQIDTYKDKLGEKFGKSKIAITKMLNRLYDKSLAKRLDNGKLQIF